MRIIFYIK